MDLELAEIMRRLADGDGTAVLDLVDGYRPELERAVRSVAMSRRLPLSSAKLDELVVDVAIVLAQSAAAWDPSGGAPPWVWARHRIANVVDGYIGQWAKPLTDDLQEQAMSLAAPPPTERERSLVATLDDIARRSPVVGLLAEAIGLVATERDQQLYLEVLVEMAAGNRAPADAVARLHGLKPATVRQQFRRVRVRLQCLAATHERFAPLAELPAVA